MTDAHKKMLQQLTFYIQDRGGSDAFRCDEYPEYEGCDTESEVAEQSLYDQLCAAMDSGIITEKDIRARKAERARAGERVRAYWGEWDWYQEEWFHPLMSLAKEAAHARNCEKISPDDLHTAIQKLNTGTAPAQLSDEVSMDYLADKLLIHTHTLAQEQGLHTVPLAVLQQALEMTHLLDPHTPATDITGQPYFGTSYGFWFVPPP